jgi:endonuclease/exonuclease/phosphatase family metal-dependent hydrolase
MLAPCLLATTLLIGVPTREGGPLRVATYNILAGERGLKGLADTLSLLDADLIALEEVDVGTRRSGRADQATRLAATLKLRHVFIPHFDYQGGQFGLALLSKHPISRVQRVRVKGIRLSVLDATVRLPGATVRVIVVHFTVTFPFRSDAEQSLTDAARLREAEAALALVKATKGPVLVLGDMNDDTGSPPYELFRPLMQDSCEVSGAGLAKTWNSALPVTRIDYVWASRHFKVLGCRTEPSTASDHLPVVATLELDPRGR